MRTTARHAAAALATTLVAMLMPGTAAAPGVPALRPDFLWGVAVSGFQAEGHAPDSNWLRYIRQHPEFDDYGDAVDFYHRYPEDIRLAAALGVQVFRIGVEWARLQPDGRSTWDEAAFQFYDKVVAEIVAAGMRPMLTLDHWVYPGWAYDRGGWDHPDMVRDWVANARRVVDRYADRNPLWVTINEPVAYISHEVALSGADRATMEKRVAAAHNAIYDHIHQRSPDAMVTSNVGYVAGNDLQINGSVLADIGPRLDYIGFDYYYGFEPPKPDPSELWELPVRPEGIYFALRRYARLFPGKPLFIVENGITTENHAPHRTGYTRAEHLRDSIYWVQRAAADGMNIIGYNYWSLTDNYEWGSYKPRFGLYRVDAAAGDLTRVPTEAAAAYAAIVAADGVTPHYRPSRPPADCTLIDPPASCAEPVTLR
ncbi:family 1 glycosylhydrolase [Nocardia sp. NPDC048505]|uniref:glycoside hydrolase family 1 protein n=1 Tax=Nocardia sp. NPDC048505 TaxID=3155756 RepID=UPI0033F590C7